MRCFYDCEFLEDGETIELISIGMVADNGRELYLVNRDAPWKRIKKNEWLMANVVPSLPQPHGDWINQMPKRWLIDFHNPVVRSRDAIATAVETFLLGDQVEGPKDLELWADYGAYDHVALCQLFGRMIDLPSGVPMFTNDLQQELRRLGNPAMPEQAAGLHNALADARHLKACFEALIANSTIKPGPAAGDPANTGHGHVRPRPDGMKARCGGPGICSECSVQQAQAGTSA